MTVRSYLRLLPETSIEDDERVLRARLAATPGVSAIASIQRHLRGGYAVMIEWTGDAEALVAHLRQHGYRAVL